MTAYDSLLIRYGELCLKNNNRARFERQLKRNLEDKLSADDHRGLVRFEGGLRIQLNPDSPVPSLLDRLSRVPGIAWYAPTWEAGRSPESILETILEQDAPEASTFAVCTQRSDKNLELNSMEYNEILGRELLVHRDLEVDLDDPDWSVHVHLLNDRSHVFFRKHDGLGGLPVNTAGDVLVLLSGGIDSPVAAIEMMKRGCRVDFVHFYAYPNARTALEEKIGPLVETLAEYGTRGRLFMVPYHPFDLHGGEVPQRKQLILFRRHMIRTAQALAERHDLPVLVTGESLGQVASQTLENLAAIDDATDRPILRPLVGRDKQEIIDRARQFGTYELSIQEYQDCCAIQARHPDTRTAAENLRRIEAREGLNDVTGEALEATEVFEYDEDGLSSRELSPAP